jgi:hypothetical protein
MVERKRRRNLQKPRVEDSKDRRLGNARLATVGPDLRGGRRQSAHRARRRRGTGALQCLMRTSMAVIDLELCRPEIVTFVAISQ